MTNTQKEEITKIAKEFASGFEESIGQIAGSGWLIVDPLSGYLNFCGYKNKLSQIPENEKHPLILIMTFDDGTTLIPSGSDMPHPKAMDWMWI